MEREINYLVFRYLEKHLNPEDYEQLKKKLLPKLKMPLAYNWAGSQVELSFEQLLFERFHFPQDYLIDLFGKLVHNSKTPIYANENIGFVQTPKDIPSMVKIDAETPLKVKNSTFSLMKRNLKFCRKRPQALPSTSNVVEKLDRMKTIYGHANPGEQPMSISCILFDMTNKYIITGADDKLIKVWLTLNGSLQGVLHGHTDVINDLKMSYCNRYIISCGKEGVINIWDLKNLKHLHSFSEHKQSVNNIKVVPTKLLNSDVQLLYSCSDDGLINVYNLDKVNQHESTNIDEMQIKTRRFKPQKSTNPLFLFSLSSIEYTGLKKNKKLTVIEISNRRGLIFTGCYGGDLQVWRTDNYRRDRIIKESYELVSKIKAHQNTLHIIALSPDENYFMTGSIDGTACIWKQPETGQDIIELIKDLESGRKDGSAKKEHHQVKINPFKELAISQCDSLKWSCRGRYAIAAFGGKETDDSPNEKSVIYVWDMKNRVMLREYGGKDSTLHLDNFTFVLETHPKYENYFISGGGGGKVILWDITKESNEDAIVKTFTESGIYERDPNILNEVFDGQFSSCGKHFAISTVWGTFTIYSIFNKESYYATPVEQFFQYDKAPESHSNIYNEVDAYL